MDAHGRISILHATTLRMLWYTIGHSHRPLHSLPQRAHRRAPSGTKQSLQGGERDSRTRQQGSTTNLNALLFDARVHDK
jgi:hypothetical protein